MASTIFHTNTSPAHGASTQFIGSTPMIKSWPGLQYLVPIYTLQDSLSILASQLSPDAGAVGIQRASRLVDKFLGGGLLSNKNVFRGLCTIYIQEISYDDPDRGLINIDRSNRLDDCNAVISALESMQKPLRQLAANGTAVASSEVLGYLDEAKGGLRSFLSKVPSSDFEKVKAWITAVNAADANRNGILEGAELDSLGKEDKELYQAVGDLLG